MAGTVGYQLTAMSIAGELRWFNDLSDVAAWPDKVLRGEAQAALTRYEERKRAKLQAANDAADVQ